MLDLMLYLLYACDIPLQEDAMVATLADGTVMIAVCEIIEEATHRYANIILINKQQIDNQTQ